MNNYHNYKNYCLVSLIVLALLSSCAPAIQLQESETVPPARFSDLSTDSTSTASEHWASVFSDPYLKALIDTALQHNQELNMLVQEVRMEENEVLARKGEYLPFVHLQAGMAADKVGEFTRDGAVEENLPIAEEKAFPKVLGDYMLGASVSWEVDIWRKLRNARKSAFLRYLASVEGRNFAVTQLVAEIARSYYELLALDNQLKNVERNISILNSSLEIVKAQKEAAATTELGVRRFEAEVLKNQSVRYSIRQQITEVENRLNYLAGRFPQPIQRDTSNLIDLPIRTISAGVPARLLQNRPDIKRAELELEAAKIDVAVSRAAFYPSLDIRAGLGYQAFNPTYLFHTPGSVIFSLAGDLVAPVVNRKGIQAAFNTANARQVQAMYRYEQTLLNAYTEVANQLAKVQNLQQAFDVKARQVDALGESVQISNELFRSARADYFEVLQTQRETLEAQIELVEIKAEQIDAFVTMYQALGGGWR